MFAITGDVLTLVLASPSGLTKSGNKLALDPLSTGGLQIATTGASIKVLSTGGIETDATGAAVKLDGTSLTSGADGLRVNVDLIDWPNLTASRLLATDATETLESVANLASWIAGTADQITVSNDGDGSVTLAISSTTLDRITALEAADAQFEGQVYYSGGP